MRKYRFWAAAMTAAVVLTACGNGSDAAESTTQTAEQSTESEETSSGIEETETEPETGNEDVETRDALFPLNVELSAKYEGEWDDKGAIITADSAMVYILDDGYESLKETLNAYNEMNWQEVYTMYLEHREYANEDIFPEGTELYISREIEVTRADHKVLSFINAESSYVGGAHGSYYENAEVFDAESGEVLELSDVVTDYDKVYEFVLNSLKENYDQEMFFDDYEEWIREMFYEPGGAMASPVEWNMDMDGIVFRFSPYVIGPWAAGTFEAKLPYEGNEELFVKEYIPVTSGGRIRKIQPEETFEIDSDRNGYQETVYFTVSEMDEEYCTTLQFHMKEEQGPEGGNGDTAEGRYYGTFTNAYLVQVKDSDYYLYAEFLSENDFRKLYVIDLNQNSEEGHVRFSVICDTDEAMYGHFAADSGRFALYSRIYTLGTYSGYRTYHAGEDGMPVPDEEMYTIVNAGMDWERTLTSKRELTVMMHVDGSEEKVEEKLPKGTVFKPRKTDGASVMEMELEDGRRCDIPLEKEEDDYIYKINGVSEYDCFESLPYAG